MTAATLLAVLFVAPIVKGPATVSAAEILAKSANLLAAQPTTGVEVLEYELALDGVPREMMPDHADGVYHVKQVIDHDATGRYLLATYGPDGQLLSSVAQDPATRRRVVALLVDDQPYRFEFNVPDSVALSLPEMERLHMQASVAMMQASGDKQPAGGRHAGRPPIPHPGAARQRAQTPTAVWDLAEARGRHRCQRLPHRRVRGEGHVPEAAVQRVVPVDRPQHRRARRRPTRSRCLAIRGPSRSKATAPPSLLATSWSHRSASMRADEAGRPVMARSRDSSRGLDEILRRGDRRRRPVVRGRARRGLRFPRRQWRGQDDHDEAAARSAAPDARTGRPSRASTAAGKASRRGGGSDTCPGIFPSIQISAPEATWTTWRRSTADPYRAAISTSCWRGSTSAASTCAAACAISRTA